MKFTTILLLFIVAALCFVCFCSVGLGTLTKLPSSDELPVYPTRVPLDLSSVGPIFIQEPTGPPYYVYSGAINTREN